MVGRGKVTGTITLAVGIVILLLATGWLFTGISEGRLRSSGLILGLVISLIVVLPLIIGGIYLIVKGRREAQHFAELEKEKRLLGIIGSQGQVSLDDAAIELDVSRPELKQMIYDLVNKELFTGYINWEARRLYAKQAAQIQGSKCPHCGGRVELAGKGVFHCPYCGSEVFL